MIHFDMCRPLPLVRPPVRRSAIIGGPQYLDARHVTGLFLAQPQDLRLDEQTSTDRIVVSHVELTGSQLWA